MVTQPDQSASGNSAPKAFPARATLDYAPKGTLGPTRMIADLIVALVIIGGYVVFFTCLGVAFVFGE